MNASRSLVSLAAVTKTQGLKGEIRVSPAGGESENLLDLPHIFLRKSSNEPIAYQIESSRRKGPGVYILKLAGVDSIDAAQTLIGAEVLADPADFHPLEDGEYYWFQLTGLRVFAANGAELGIVESLFATGSNDVLVVRSGDHVRYIPYTDDAVARVDPAAGTLTLTSQPGIEEL